MAGGINPYAYADNNPINWADPWGLAPDFSGNEQLKAEFEAEIDECNEAARRGFYRGLAITSFFMPIAQGGFGAGFGGRLPAPELGVRKGIARYSQLINKLTRFKNVRGSKTVSGAISQAESNFLGKRWVGNNHKVVTTKKGDTIYIPKDGLRQYRAPTRKSSPYSKTGVQANFQSRDVPSGEWVNNAHIDVY